MVNSHEDLEKLLQDDYYVNARISSEEVEKFISAKGMNNENITSISEYLERQTGEVSYVLFIYRTQGECMNINYYQNDDRIIAFANARVGTPHIYVQVIANCDKDYSEIEYMRNYLMD